MDFIYGMKKAYKEGYDWIWVMDDDTIVTKNALKELINAKNILLKKRIKFGFLNSIVYWKDNNLCLFNLPTAKNDINTYQFLSHGMIKINRATFVSFLISKKIIKIVGLPLKEFFIWADDTEYTLRISLNYDLPGYYISKSKVYHLTKLNSFYSYEFINRENYKKYCYDIRNRVYIIKNIPQIKYKLDYLKVTLINLLRILFSKKIIYFPALIFSLIWGIFFNPKIEKVD
ncbi:MAG: glycosyltransferase [Candidatus Goldbacteria bacterium]|nr:glycosyltransferase [Candidatus Goldiibacteriota bacterium]